jgi:ATP-dependent Clp protease adapter protein ClpS
VYDCDVDQVVLLLGTVFASAALWAWQRRRYRGGDRTLAELCDDDLQVALHLARHLAGDGDVTPSDLIRALIQDAGTRGAIERLGGDPVAIEARCDQLRAPGDTERILGGAVALARLHGRRASCTDVWSRLLRDPASAALESPPVSGHALLFVLAHGVTEPPARLADASHVHVVLRNDDYTPRPVVVTILCEVFELTEPDATARMEQVERDSRGVISRLPAELASARVEAAREKAREASAPLWIGVEPT